VILLGNSLLLFLALDLAVFLFILGLILSGNFLVLLVLDFESVLGGLFDMCPHIADDLGDFCDLGSWVIGLDLIIDFSSVEEES